MRIPLPVFYVAESPDGRIIVVDGLQRLTTFIRFLAGDLKLNGPVAELCRSFNRVLCAKGERLWERNAH